MNRIKLGVDPMKYKIKKLEEDVDNLKNMLQLLITGDNISITI